MAEYIEREAVMLQINVADFVCDDNYEAGATLLFQDDVVDRISSIPAADVRPVVRARWTDHRTNEHDGEWYCSACGEEPWWCGVTEDILPMYCPNCGAMMEES